MKQVFRHYSYVIFFLVSILCVFYGAWMIPKIGISWDEPFQRDTGILAWRYVFKNDQSIMTHKDRWYGTGFELVLVAVEYAFRPVGSRAVYLLRHIVTYLYNSIGIGMLCVWIALSFKNRMYGVMAVLFFLLSPRLSADMTYNSKDSVFLTAISIAYILYAYYASKPSVPRSICVGLAAAYATSIRIVGCFFPVSILVMLVWDMMARKVRVQQGITTVYILLVWGIGTYIMWPVLWHDPFGEFIRAFSAMRQFPWEGLVLFRGEFLQASKLPWYYIPWWIGISTPISLLALSIVGVGVAIVRAKDTVIARIALIWFWVPLCGVLVLRPVMYDGWRHMYFLYPAMVVFAVFAFDWMRKTFSYGVRLGIWIFIGIEMVSILLFIMRTDPYQYIYVNWFAGGYEKAKAMYDLDYWGLTLFDGIRYVADNDSSEHIIVYAPNTVGDPIAYMLPENDRRRIVITDSPKEAGYFIGNYRWYPSEYPFPHPPVFERRIGTVRIMGVWDISSYTIITGLNGFDGR